MKTESVSEGDDRVFASSRHLQCFNLPKSHKTMSVEEFLSSPEVTVHPKEKKKRVSLRFLKRTLTWL